MKKLLFVCCALGVLVVGCKRTNNAVDSARSVGASDKRKVVGQKPVSRAPVVRYMRHGISPKLRPAPAIESYIAPFRAKLRKQMAKVLAKTRVPLIRKRPNSALGNLTADGSRLYFRMKLKQPVDVFLTNFGGIRNDFPKGAVTVGTVYESFPFDNKLVWFRLTGAQLLTILETVARRGGEPISGAKLLLKRGKKPSLSRAWINGKPLQQRRTYIVGSIGYLVKTGYLKPHMKGIAFEKTNAMLRDVMLWSVKQKGLVARAKRDTRIAFGK
jgi:2',3'-cyclic-nucleotide 2'-phosphodiesterase (5'-nucleotidase family)